MSSPTPALRHDMHIVNDAEDYRDLDVYVTTPNGNEWLIRCYRDKENGAITRLPGRFAATTDDDFNDTGETPEPAEVTAHIEALWPEILRQLNPNTPVKAPE